MSSGLYFLHLLAVLVKHVVVTSCVPSAYQTMIIIFIKLSGWLLMFIKVAESFMRVFLYKNIVTVNEGSGVKNGILGNCFDFP